MAINTAIFNNDPDMVDWVYGEGRLARLRAMSTCCPGVVAEADFEARAAELAGVEAIFSTWGFWLPSPAQLARMPALRAVFYAAGGTDHFAPALIERGIDLFAAWRANGRPVAEFVLGQILLALKGYFRHTRELTGRDRWRGMIPGVNDAFIGPGAYREHVALIGDGEIARRTRQLLEATDVAVTILPTTPSKRAMSLEEAFRRAFVVSNHLPDRADNKQCITAAHFASMRPGATFINTGRGGQVDTDGLVAVARARPDLTFLLDVVDPEPPPEGHPLYTLPNVVLTAHIAGSMNGEVLRMADFMLDDFDAWRRGEPTRNQVRLEALTCVAPLA